MNKRSALLLLLMASSFNFFPSLLHSGIPGLKAKRIARHESLYNTAPSSSSPALATKSISSSLTKPTSAGLPQDAKELFEGLLLVEQPLSTIATFTQAAVKLRDILDGSFRKDPRKVIAQHAQLQELVLYIVLKSKSILSQIDTIGAKERKNALTAGIRLYEEILEQKEKLGLTTNPRVSNALEELTLLLDSFVEKQEPLTPQETEFLSFLKGLDLSQTAIFNAQIKALYNRINGSIISDKERAMIGENPAIRTYFFSSKGVLLPSLPQGLTLEAHTYGKKLYTLLRKNPRDFGYADLPNRTTIENQLDALLQSLSDSSLLDTRFQTLSHKEQGVLNELLQFEEEIKSPDTMTKAISQLVDMLDGGFDDRKKTIATNSILLETFQAVTKIDLELVHSIIGLPPQAEKLKTSTLTQLATLAKTILRHASSLRVTDQTYIAHITELQSLTAQASDPLTTEEEAFFAQLKTACQQLQSATTFRQAAQWIYQHTKGTHFSDKQRERIGNNYILRSFFFSPQGILLPHIPEGLDTAAIQAGIILYEEVIKNPNDFGYKKDPAYQTITESLQHIYQILKAHPPSSSDSSHASSAPHDFFTQLKETTAQLRSASTFESAAQWIYHNIKGSTFSDTQRERIGKNPAMRDFFFSDEGILLIRLPDGVSGNAAKAGAQLFDELKSNPRDFGYASLPHGKSIKEKLTSLYQELVQRSKAQASFLSSNTDSSVRSESTTHISPPTQPKTLEEAAPYISHTPAGDLLLRYHERLKQKDIHAFNEFFLFFAPLITSETKRITIGKNALLRDLLLSDEGLLFDDIPEGLSPQAHDAAKAIYTAILKNPRELNYKASPHFEFIQYRANTYLQDLAMKKTSSHSIPEASSGPDNILHTHTSSSDNILFLSEAAQYTPLGDAFIRYEESRAHRTPHALSSLFQDLASILETERSRDAIGANPELRNLLLSEKGVLFDRLPEALTERGKSAALTVYNLIKNNPRDLAYKSDAKKNWILARIESLMRQIESTPIAQPHTIHPPASSPIPTTHYSPEPSSSYFLSTQSYNEKEPFSSGYEYESSEYQEAHNATAGEYNTSSHSGSYYEESQRERSSTSSSQPSGYKNSSFTNTHFTTPPSSLAPDRNPAPLFASEVEQLLNTFYRSGMTHDATTVGNLFMRLYPLMKQYTQGWFKKPPINFNVASVFSEQGLLLADVPEHLTSEARTAGIELYKMLIKNEKTFGYNKLPRYAHIVFELKRILHDITYTDRETLTSPLPTTTEHQPAHSVIEQILTTYKKELATHNPQVFSQFFVKALEAMKPYESGMFKKGKTIDYNPAFLFSPQGLLFDFIPSPLSTTGKQAGIALYDMLLKSPTTFKYSAGDVGEGHYRAVRHKLHILKEEITHGKHHTPGVLSSPSQQTMPVYASQKRENRMKQTHYTSSTPDPVSSLSHSLPPQSSRPSASFQTQPPSRTHIPQVTASSHTARPIPAVIGLLKAYPTMREQDAIRLAHLEEQIRATPSTQARGKLYYERNKILQQYGINPRGFALPSSGYYSSPYPATTTAPLFQAPRTSNQPLTPHSSSHRTSYSTVKRAQRRNAASPYRS